jgi:glucose/arabinose dehydrogenase
MSRQNKSLSRFVGSFCLTALVLLLSSTQAAAQDYIVHTVAQNGDPGFANFANPTTLALAPDGRLFAGQSNGRIHAISLSGLHVTNVQVIDTIFNRGLSTNGRLVTGIAFGPGGDLFVSHSDGRTYDNAVDPFSGTVTRLFASSGYTGWVDIVTGLPRSKADHAPNGLAFGPDGALYLAIGGMTNAGRPSPQFFNQAEQTLSAAILRINVSTGQITLHATGFRNPYDLVWHTNGQLYATDNGANSGLGNTTDSSTCLDGPDPGTPPDELNRIIAGRYYGHPNPSRSQCVFNGGFNFTGPIATFGASVNGIAEYTSSRVPAFQGNLFTANFNSGQINRVQLSPTGTSVVSNTIYASGLDNPLDVRVSSDGRIYVAEFGGNAIKVILPAVSFRSSNGFYVVAEGAGGDVVNANRTAIGPWEKFALIDLNGGTLQSGDAVHVLAPNGVHYVVAEGGGAPEGTPPPNGRVFANRTVPLQWETFIIGKADGTAGVITNNQQITLQSYLGYFVVAEGGGAPQGSPPPAGEVYANRVVVGPWETFTIVMQ